MRSKINLAIFLVAVFAILSLYTWDAKTCFNPDELFYYKSTQAVSSVRDIYAPKYFEKHRFQKPPLFYSFVFLAFKAFGVNWFSARIVTVLSSILVLLITYLLGKRMFGGEKAFIGMGSLATSVLFFRFGRIVLPEMMLIFFMTGAFYFAYAAFSQKKRPFFYVAFIFMAMGTLVKGPVAFALPAAAILAFYVMNRRKYSLAPVPWARGAFIIIGAYLVWVIPAVLIYGKEFTGHVATVEVVNRFTEKVQFESFLQLAWHQFKKFSFYIPVLFAEYLPWSVLFPAMLIAGRRDIDKKDHPMQRSFLLTWAVTGFLMFTLIPAKRAHYVLSLFPAISLYFASFFSLEKAYIKKAFKIFLSAALVVYFLVVMIAFPLIFTDGVDRLSVKLESALQKENIPVAVSWRLDPQEVELYVDKPVYIVWETDFENGTGNVSPRIREMVSLPRENGSIFYFLLAQKEYSAYLEKFLASLEKVTKGPVVFSTLDEDRLWKKRIGFRKLFHNAVKNPAAIKDHLEDAFREEVYLIVVKEK